MQNAPNVHVFIPTTTEKHLAMTDTVTVIISLSLFT